MKKSGEYVGVDEKFIPEDEKYIDESLLGNKEKSKKIAKKMEKAYLVFTSIVFVFVISMTIFIITNTFKIRKEFNNYNSREMNMYTFFHLQGTQSGYKLRDYLDDFIANNKAGGYTTITVVYNGKKATTEDEILSIKNEIANTTSEVYEVSVDYADSRGQVVNKVTIKDI